MGFVCIKVGGRGWFSVRPNYFIFVGYCGEGEGQANPMNPLWIRHCSGYGHAANVNGCETKQQQKPLKHSRQHFSSKHTLALMNFNVHKISS